MSTKQSSSSSKHAVHHNLKTERGKVASKAYETLHDFTSGIKDFFRGYINSLSNGIDYVMSDGLSNDIYRKPSKKKTVAKMLGTEGQNSSLKTTNARTTKMKMPKPTKQ